MTRVRDVVGGGGGQEPWKRQRRGRSSKEANHEVIRSSWLMKKDEKVKGKKSKEAEEARVVCSISGKKGEHMMGK